MNTPYYHVDVFTDKALRGNGLAVVYGDCFTDAVMLDLAREFKQFETIFLSGFDGQVVRARIFTVEGELPFAGHPLLGAAAVLHRQFAKGDTLSLRVALESKTVPIVSKRAAHGYHVQMNQGKPQFLGRIPTSEIPWLLQAFSLTMEDLHPTLPPEVVSTGLSYVILPVQGCLQRARITVDTLEKRIAAYGAAYVYLFDVDSMEARTWDNGGLIEDSATGSAAGPSCAYLHRHGHVAEGENITIKQGQYCNRPGVLFAQMRDGDVLVSGDVVFFAEGCFTL